MPKRLPIIDLDRLRLRAGELSTGFDSRRWRGRANWLVVQVMMDHDFRQKEIAEFLDLHHTTVNFYESHTKPWPGEIELLETLRREFPPMRRQKTPDTATLDTKPSGIRPCHSVSPRSTQGTTGGQKCQ